VAPHRGRGIGSALLEAVSEHALRAGYARLRCTARANDPDALRFLERRGFRIRRHIDQVSLELGDGGPVATEPPAGITLGWLAERPADVHGMYLVAQATAVTSSGIRSCASI
jgi:ribosomal protein S18 acetylase RimI-like enzyme